ncbi:hypothetical protein [Sediminibacillus massiliensis]|uniref:hypothetical protein n=1 Tax=Sediminibacillus massiliensis TaxID=1926277 RepID=UPI0009885870|nr:hypothetical protein [Sediminibacillus massiliensis]
MNDYHSLKLLDKGKGLFTMLGIEYPVMRRIVQVKLTMDQQRVPAIYDQAKNKDGNNFLRSLGIYALYGLALLPFILIGTNYLFQMSLVFGMILFILMTTMISDFSTVLLDVRDKTILQTKPISKRTINAAKIVHICIYMVLITGAFTGIPLIVSLFRQGILFTLLFLAELLLVSLLIVVFTALIYLFILRFFSGEHLKDIINYVQILLSVGLIIGYQVLIRVFEITDFSVAFSFEWWQLLVPPLWYGAPFELFLNHNTSGFVIVYSILALVIPILSIMLYAKLLPSFERNLQKLLESSGSNMRKGAFFDQAASRITCTTNEERAFFRFASKMMKEEREFKLKVYPSLGMAIIFPFIFLFNDLRTDTISSIGDSTRYLVIYFCNVMIPAAVHMLKFSGNYKGAWIYRAAPIKEEGMIYRATLKAFLMKLYVPVFTVTSCIFLAIFSVEIIPDLMVVLIAGWMHALLSYKLLIDEKFPFSQSFVFAHSADTAKNILMILFAGIFAVLHYAALSIQFGIYVYMVLLAASTWFAWKRVFAINIKTQERPGAS